MRQITGTDAWLMCKTNFYLAVRNNIILASAYLLMIPLLRGIANLDRARSVECLNQSVALIGIFLLVPLGAPEQQERIREIVSAKKIPHWKILLLRWLMSLLALALMISVFAGIMLWNNCTFPFVPCVAGTMANAVALGSMGFLTAVLSRSAIAGYLVSAGYFLLHLLRM